MEEEAADDDLNEVLEEKVSVAIGSSSESAPVVAADNLYREGDVSEDVVGKDDVDNEVHGDKVID